MTTTFLLDPRVLDDCVSDSAPDVEIEAKGAGYMRFGHFPEYVFYQEGQLLLPSALTELDHKSERLYLGSRRLLYSRATVFLVSSNDGWNSLPTGDQPRMDSFAALYVHGEFLKGDAEAFKNNGIHFPK